MAVPTSYSELQTEIARKMVRDDVTDTVTSAIGEAECMFNRTLWVPEREEVSTTSTADSTIALPTDYCGMRSVYISDTNKYTLTEMSLDHLRDKYSTTTTDRPQNYAIQGAGEMVVGPTPDQSYTYVMNYWQTIPALSDAITSNWLLVAYPDVYVHAGLMYAYAELRDQEGYVAEAAITGDMLAQIMSAGRRKTLTPGGRRLRIPRGFPMHRSWDAAQT